jgi:hypothetical protein
MLIAALVGTLLLIWVWRTSRKGPARLEAGDLRRLRQLSEKDHDDGIRPF